MIIQTIDLNLIPDSEPVIVHVDQYDTGTGRIRANLYNGDQTYSPSGTAVIQGTKPDGHGFIYAATISGNVVTANLTEQMTACAGNVRTQIVVTETNGRTGTFCFTLAVQKSGLPADTDMSASDYQMVEEMIEAAYSASSNPPIIGQNGNWWVWSLEQGQYVDTGVDASITVRIADITMLAPDATPYVTNTGTSTDPIFHLFIPRGKGITSIAKVSTSGLVDTYRITYSDGAHYDYTITNGAKGDTGDPAGFGTPTATIDNNSGTPSVEVSATGEDTAKVFSFAFHNLKGDQGVKGDPGDMPTITASGSVDSNFGVPSVEITQTGTAANPNLNFAFHNMRGADGGGSMRYDPADGCVIFTPPTS